MDVWLQYKFLNITLTDWLYTLLISIVAYLLIVSIWKIALDKLGKIAIRTVSNFDDTVLEVMRTTKHLTFALFAFLIGMHFLDLSERWITRLDHLSFVIIGLQIAAWVNKGISIWAKRKAVSTDGNAEDNAVITTMLSWIFKTVVWSILLLSILANIGVNITALVASLGIGGIAVALAVQNILSDLFASLSIGLDKPFVIGDFIVFGDVAGTIERVGLKTTHIRSLSGEQIVCSNTELLKNTIHNYKRMAQRRILFGFGVTYDTKVELLERIPGIVKTAVESQEKTRFDRAHMKDFGASSLNFEVVYFILDSDFNVYMDVQHAVNLSLMREFESLGVQFAFPTMTLNIPEPSPIQNSGPKKSDKGTADPAG